MSDAIKIEEQLIAQFIFCHIIKRGDFMHFFSVIFLTFSANIDCLLLGLSYSMKNIRISFYQNLFIALLTTLGTFLSMKLGHYIISFISVDTANHIGALFMILIGMIMLFQKPNSSESLFIIKTHNLSWKETGLLGMTLSINNIGLSLGASITGLPYASTCLLTFFISLFFIAISQALRQSLLLNKIQSFAPLLSSLMILLLGLYEFIV